jgi:mannose-1-phosphate guanylyltransferase/mannose-6-phosphate isomerase
VGSWGGFWDIADKDTDGNTLVGDALTYDVHNSLLKSDGKLLVALGLDNVVIVDTDDVTLVADKDKSERIKDVVNDLKHRKRPEIEAHMEVHRPWGSFKGMEQTDHYQVKKLVLKPGAKISLQLHHKRSEHWVVVKGTAKVVRGDDVITLKKDQSTFIPVGTKHQLENIGDKPLEVIEVQTGTYFGEDDIVRFDDIYGRV